MGKIQSFFGEPLKHARTVRGQILVSRTDDDPLPPVCGFRTSPCVPAPRAHVFQHMFQHRHTRGRFECTHGGALEAQYGFFHVFFSACRNSHTHQTHNTTTNNTTTTTTHTTQHNTQHHTETERERERQRERDRERQRKKERQRNRVGSLNSFGSRCVTSPCHANAWPRRRFGSRDPG